MIGKQTPDFSPLRLATGAREQVFISPRSGTKTRSRVCQAWPLSPSPSRNRASAVTRRNSSLTEPASCDEPQRLLLGVDLPERPVGPAERLADRSPGPR